jgi:hypothetical protein
MPMLILLSLEGQADVLSLGSCRACVTGVAFTEISRTLGVSSCLFEPG